MTNLAMHPRAAGVPLVAVEEHPDPFAAVNWPSVLDEIDAGGVARLGRVVTASEATSLASLYDAPAHFRSKVIMARHGFGRGEYQYFAHPLPPIVTALRRRAYERLAPLANRWHERLNVERRFPEAHEAFLAECHAAGQHRPTPLLLRYGAGDYNCLHQDLYGAVYFPFQMVVLLSEPGRDFTGGELALVEQRPRMQSRVEVVPLGLGEAAIFAVRERPVRGTRGDYRVQLRHGVSRLRSGSRHTLGIIFHDAT